ncbi:MAG: flavodoxin family protein [Cyanobacteria bacterium SIG31]|nr:flavodoxin family protein [Cyanobacteria bacterium SIG31]
MEKQLKVLLFNGSPHKEGCTYTALKEIATTLEHEGIVSEIFHVGDDAIASCKACGACTKLGKCVIDDKVNEFVKLAEDFDGFIIGSPVHYASSSGATVAFLDRAFYSASRSGKKIFPHKPGAAIASARRAGTTATLDQLNKYFTINQMILVSGRYWNMVHGRTPEDVVQDVEGMQNMRFLARNMAWTLKCIQAGKNVGINPPIQEEVVMTNFIR